MIGIMWEISWNILASNFTVEEWVQHDELNQPNSVG